MHVASQLYNGHGGERGPVTLPAFKAGDPFLRGTGGGFDSHTLPPPSFLRPLANLPDQPKTAGTLGTGCDSEGHRLARLADRLRPPSATENRLGSR